MKVLVAGSVPPPANGRRASLLEEVVRLRRQGHDVEVLALDPIAAAHRYLSAPGLAAAFEVGMAGRRVDAVVIQLEPGLPVRPDAGRAERALVLLVFAFLLRRLPEVTLRWDLPDDLPGGPGGRPGMVLWRSVRHIELGPEVSELVTGLVADAESRVTVGLPRVAAPTVAPGTDRLEGPEISAAEVNELVRRRAAVTRQVLSPKPEARVEQWEWLPAPGLGVPNLGPLPASTFGLVKGVAWKSLAARMLPVGERHPATRGATRLARSALMWLRAAKRRH